VVLVVALKNMHIAQSREEAFYHARNRHALRGVKACGRLFMGGSLKNMHLGHKADFSDIKNGPKKGRSPMDIEHILAYCSIFGVP